MIRFRASGIDKKTGGIIDVKFSRSEVQGVCTKDGGVSLLSLALRLLSLKNFLFHYSVY